MDDLRYWQLVHIRVPLLLQLSIHRTLLHLLDWVGQVNGFHGDLHFAHATEEICDEYTSWIPQEKVSTVAWSGHTLTLGTDFEQVIHVGFACRMDVFQELQKVEGVTIHQMDSYGQIWLVRQGVLSNLTAGQSHEVWRVEPLVHGGALTGVNDEEQLIVPPFLPHLLKRVGKFHVTNLLRVLELKEAIPTVAGQVYEDVAAVIREEAFGARSAGWQPSSQNTQEVLHCHLISSVVHLHIVSVHIQLHVLVAEHCGRFWVSVVTSHVISQHEHYVAVRNAQPLNTSVDGQSIGHMTVVEPESGCTYQNSPVVGMATAEELCCMILDV